MPVARSAQLLKSSQAAPLSARFSMAKARKQGAHFDYQAWPCHAFVFGHNGAQGQIDAIAREVRWMLADCPIKSTTKRSLAE